jgi:hypothetical protein
MMSGVLWKVLSLPVTLTVNGYYSLVNGVVRLFT